MSVRVWAIAYGFISILLLLLRSFARVFFHIWIVYTKRVRACHWVFFVCCCLSVCHSFEKMIHKIVVKSSCAIKIDIAQNYNDFQRKMKWNFAVYIIWVREKEIIQKIEQMNERMKVREWKLLIIYLEIYMDLDQKNDGNQDKYRLGEKFHCFSWCKMKGNWGQAFISEAYSIGMSLSISFSSNSRSQWWMITMQSSCTHTFFSLPISLRLHIRFGVDFHSVAWFSIATQHIWDFSPFTEHHQNEQRTCNLIYILCKWAILSDVPFHLNIQRELGHS